MRIWLKRMVAGIVSAGTLMGGGLLMAGTANADEIRMPDIGKTITSLTASAATTYPRELVNGDFEYPSMKSLQHYFTGIDRNRSQWISNGQGDDLAKWSDIPGGLDTTRFGWSSTQTQGAMSEQRANAVELQKATGETTQMGELCASQKGTAIYQDIATTPGTLYRIELDHASRYRIHLDQMQVMVGAPGHEQPVEMTRTSSNKYGDKIGEKSTTIATHSTNPFGNQSSKDDFSHYVGYYTIPAGQSVTRFTFRQVSGVNTTSGNLLDNIVFTQAYKLDYDRNSDEATGQTPNDTATVKPAKTSATGGVKNVADTNASLPGHLVNGDFEYLPDGGWKTVDAPSYMTNAYTSVDPNNGQYMRNAKHSDADLASWVDWPGFDQSKFAWKTDQKGGHDQGGLKDRAEAVELQQDSMDGNTYAEMVASEPGRTIYQNLATIPGTLYKIRLKHASLCKDNVDQMQVVINGTPIEMTRVAANGKAGDKVGEKSKTIGTRVTNGNRWHHSDQWETYEGYYVIPDGQTTTRFGFKAVNYLDPTKGNLLDDVTFACAYKLSYDKNASDATGKVPSDETAGTVRQTKARTTGTVKTVADENVRYGSLANGDFSYPSFSDIQENEQGTDAELATYGVNGFAGAKHDSGPESNLDGKQQVKHRLAATWTGSSFTFGYDLQNPEGRDRGSRMTFGVPVTRTKVLTYDANGGKGSVPSHTEAGKVESASVKTAGSVQVQTIATTGAVSGCQVYYPAGTRITLATAKADSDCWDSSQIGKTNRTFYGWSANTDANDRDVPVADTMDRNTLNANVRTEIVMPARAKTVYALWAINPTLSYNVNTPAGSNAPGTPASQTAPYNTAAADKSGWAAGDTGKIPGYRFDGWYTAPNGGNKYDFNTPLTNNVTVYAHWIGNGYTVRFTGNGATGGNTPDQAFQYNIGQNLHRNGFTRDGYTFTGWKRADNQQAYGDGQWVTNLTTQPDGIVTMVAQWSANEAHIRYNPNPPAGKTAGGQGTPNWDGHTGDTPAIGGNGWTIDGYTFAGWTTSPDGSGTKYAPGASWTANGTLTLYAQWTPGEAGLTYDGNGATGGKTDPQNGVTDQKVNVRQNGFTRDGYTFVRWDTQADCRGKAVNPGDKWTLQGSSTLYACWAGVAQTLTYHGNGATGGNTAAQSGKTGDELTTNANGFTRDGYTFVRWDTAKDGSGTAYGEGKNGVSQYVMKPAGNDLYAIWKANPATIQYRNDWPNTTGSTPDTTGNTGDTVTISQNSFDRPGYTFTGWSTSKRGDPSLQPGDKHTLEPRTTTVWAQWKADPAHLVYNSNIGTVGSETKTVDGVVDQTVKTITNPFDRPGYTFSGWNTQADGKGKAYATGADYVLTANDKSTPKNTSVLYAQWKINGASLKFNPNGGIGHVDDVTGDAFSTVTIPGDAKEPKITRPGYRFVGWSTEKNPPAGSTFLQPGEGKVTLPAEGSTTVYAQWEPSLTTLPFTGGQAQVPTIWLYAGFALMLIALGVMMPMLRMRMAATKRTGKHMPITGGKHAK